MSAPRLAPDTLAQLRAGTAPPPAHDPGRAPGIVHLGIGAFHRAHQAVFTQRAGQLDGDERWGILGVTQRSRGVVDQLRPQGGLYGVLESAADSEHVELVSSVVDAAYPAQETPRVLSAVAAPTTHLLSLTITEKGYCRRPDGSLDVDRDDVRADLDQLAAELAASGGPRADAAPGRTGVGLLVRALGARYLAGGEGLTVLPCDNLMDNGRATTLLVTQALAATPGSAGLAEWVAARVRFPSTMVDRIAPATTAEHRARAEAITGLHDAGLVVAEPFLQWVIEDDFAGPRPAWHLAGAQLTHDVSIYERAKLRLLNATHSMLAYGGALLGHRTIAEAVADPELYRRALALTEQDLVPTVADGRELPADLDLLAYRDSVLERFANPATGHLTIQVAMDGSQKLPIRLLAAARDRLAAGAVPEQIAAVVGAWIAFVELRRSVTGAALVVDDPLLPVIDAALAGGGGDVVDRVLALEEVFGSDLPQHDGFVAAVRAGYGDWAARL